MGLTVVIVDDHSDYRSLLRSLLQAEGFTVVGEAEDGHSAITTASTLRPQLVLVDVVLPDMDGFEVAERLTSSDNPPAVILISSRDASDLRLRLMRTRARGFIPKSSLSATAIMSLLDR